MRNARPLTYLFSIFTASLLVANVATAGTVMFADPTPNGIPYTWTATLGEEGNGNGGDNGYTPASTGNGGNGGCKEGRCEDGVSFVWRVGAKSWNEPPPIYQPPYTGWTHTSNWVALDLKCDAKVTIRVARQQGVTNGTTTYRDRLYPALSLWKGWQENGDDDHRYNNSGNIDWMNEVEYIGNQPNAKRKNEAVYRVKLKAGKYTIAIGGNPKELTPEEYANLANCGQPSGPDPDICYTYTGNHGYRAEIEAESTRGKMGY